MLETGSLEDVVRYLLSRADPEGYNAKRLNSILDKVQRRVFLGPKTMRYINELVQKIDNIECSGLAYDGMCRKISGEGKCKHRKWFARCDWYSPVSPNVKGGPLDSIGGIDE